MQIVIDISDEEYEDVKKASGCYYDFGKAILYGTPLPKGHGRLIDADALKKAYKSGNWDLHKVLDRATTVVEADKAESEVEP